MNAEQAIERSVSHTEIVRLDGAEHLPELSAQAEDWTSYVDGNVRITEFWGRTGTGSEWRVHVRQPAL
jgi:hypothetical protein